MLQEDVLGHLLYKVLILDLMLNFDKIKAWSVRCRSRAPGHDACLSNTMSRTITMQGFILAATDKYTLILD